jgi:hypothetical protein
VSPRPALIIHPEAAEEARRARLWYEARSKNAGKSFAQKRYDSDSDAVTVFAVAHLKRRPGYWSDRPA